jgi:hypothetical protein
MENLSGTQLQAAIRKQLQGGLEAVYPATATLATEIMLQV